MSSSSANCFHITTSNLRSGASEPPSLLDDVGHRHALVQDTQLAVRVRCWAGWVNVYSNEGILEKEIQQNKNDYEWDVESNLLRGTWRFLHTSTSCEHRPPSTQCTCFKGSRKHFSKLAFHPLEEQPAAVGVASHLFGFHIFLHSVLPVLLVALSYFFCDISDLKSGSIPHLVDGVDLSTGLTRHPRVSQDKLTFLMINIG